jgi:hypothetical protein
MRYLPPAQSIVCPFIQHLIRPSHFLTRPQLLLRLSHVPEGGLANEATSRRMPDGLAAANNRLL